DNISAPSFIEENLSCDTKMITCTDSEDASSDKMSGLIAIQPLDRNQVTEQTLKHELSRSISSVASVKLHDESILNNTIEGSTQRLAYWIDEAMRMGQLNLFMRVENIEQLCHISPPDQQNNPKQPI
ncbi:12477_t:CDS:2, partial [Funneliformis geosporum]